MSRDRNGVLTNPMARANKSPHVGGLTAFIADQTPAGGFCIGTGDIPHPDILSLKN